MSEFSACFLLVFGQLAVGGLAALAVPPFALLERGFYKSSAGVFVGCAVVYLSGTLDLALRGRITIGHGEIALWSAFTIAQTGYLASLWGEVGRHRARAFPLALLLGLLALSASASRYRVGPLLSPAAVLYPLAFVTGALALGAVATGMLLGHWYLIDLGLSLDPMRRLFRYFVTVVVLHVGVLVVTIVVMALAPGGAADLAERERVVRRRRVFTARRTRAARASTFAAPASPAAARPAHDPPTPHARVRSDPRQGSRVD